VIGLQDGFATASPVVGARRVQPGHGGHGQSCPDQTESVCVNDQQSQAIGLIATVQARSSFPGRSAARRACWPAADDAEGPTSRSRAWPRPAGRHAYANYILNPPTWPSQRRAWPVRHHAAGSASHRAAIAGHPINSCPSPAPVGSTCLAVRAQSDLTTGLAVANAILEAVTGSATRWVRVRSPRHRPDRAAPHIRDHPGPRQHHPPPGPPGAPTPSSSPRTSCRTWWAGRRGENVTWNAEAPALRSAGQIGRVGQALTWSADRHPGPRWKSPAAAGLNRCSAAWPGEPVVLHRQLAC